MADSDLLVAQINAAARDSENKSRPYFTRFLTEAEQMKISGIHFPDTLITLFFGGDGNEDAVRRCFGIIPSFYLETEEEAKQMFPVTGITFTYRKCDVISHREVLGTLMGLGIERDTVGDIYITEGKAAVFVTEKPAELILNTVTKIGRVGVSCSEGIDFQLPRQQFEELSYSVASLRLDNIVKSVANCSRSAASDRYIRPQNVQVNGVTCDDLSKIIKTGDTVTVRGKGKFLLSEIGDKGRKGNTHIIVKKYK